MSAVRLAAESGSVEPVREKRLKGLEPSPSQADAVQFS
jgi:hypothetical protein